MPGDGFYPQQNERVKNETIKTNLGGFLKTKIMVHSGYSYTVLEILHYVAYSLGGIHTGFSNDPKQKALEDLRKYRLINGTEVVTFQIRAIGMVVLDALFELRQAILNKYHNG